MKLTTLFLTTICLSSTLALATTFGTADRRSYVITLNPELDSAQTASCSDSICELSGDQEFVECSVYPKFKIVIANLSNSSVNRLSEIAADGHACVKSSRQQQSDFKVRPRVGLSN